MPQIQLRRTTESKIEAIKIVRHLDHALRSDGQTMLLVDAKRLVDEDRPIVVETYDDRELELVKVVAYTSKCFIPEHVGGLVSGEDLQYFRDASFALPWESEDSPAFNSAAHDRIIAVLGGNVEADIPSYK